jgi:hypothetical protein
MTPESNISPNTRWPADEEFAAVGDAEPPVMGAVGGTHSAGTT